MCIRVGASRFKKARLPQTPASDVIELSVCHLDGLCVTKTSACVIETSAL